MAQDFRNYIHAKRQKLDNQIGFLKNQGIFNDLVFYVDGYTIPSQLELRDIIVSNGGKFLYNLDSTVSHIITVNLPTSKINALKNEIVVKPDWIVNSIKENRLIEIEPFQLYIKNRDQPKINFPISKTEISSNSNNFLTSFYQSSRLHHLSTWKYELMEFTEKLLDSLPPKPVSNSVTCLMHVDMDCFFASVALRNRPDLVDKPVGISHIVSQGSSNLSNSSSSIASCNYVARSFGVSNGIPISAAIQKCPNLVLLPYDFDAYNEILVSYCDKIEPISCDEAFIDVSSAVKSDQDKLDLAWKIKQDIFNACLCNASIGISHNMLLTRLATKKAKPNGVFFLSKELVNSFMLTVPISDLPGVGWSISNQLKNIANCEQLQSIPLSTLQKEFGPKNGLKLYNQARGMDNRNLKPSKERKSIGAEVNWGIRFESTDQAKEFISNLSKEVSERMEKQKVKGKLLQLKVMQRKPEAGPSAKYLGHGICDSFSKSKPIGLSNDCSIIDKEAWSLFRSFNVLPQDVRGLGIHLSKLESSIKKENNILQIFKNAESNEKVKLLKQKGVDLDTFNELPHEIQQQIISEILENESKADVKDSEVFNNLLSPIKNEVPIKKPSTPTKTVKLKRIEISPTKNTTLTQAWGIMPQKQMEGLDVHVFNELPLDIRLEVMKNQKLENRRKKLKEEERKNQETFDSLVEEAPVRRITKIKQTLKVSDLFALIKSWIESEQDCNQFEEDLRSLFLSLFNTSEIDKIRKLAIYLLKLTETCAKWNPICIRLIKEVQDKIHYKYGQELDLTFEPALTFLTLTSNK